MLLEFYILEVFEECHSEAEAVVAVVVAEEADSVVRLEEAYYGTDGFSIYQSNDANLGGRGGGGGGGFRGGRGGGGGGGRGGYDQGPPEEVIGESPGKRRLSLT